MKEEWKRKVEEKKIDKFQGVYANQAKQPVSKIGDCEFDSHHAYHYSYILGIYLGDGYIVKCPRTYELRITQDNKYKNLMEECKFSLEVLFPNNIVSINQIRNCNASIITVYSNSLIDLFPQHGKGKKHQRKIELETWQKNIINEYPKQFLKGLIHSDGCRFIRKCKKPLKIYEYTSYNFKNYSKDILEICCDICKLLGVHYTLPNIVTISIARRKDVLFLDSFIGPKT